MCLCYISLVREKFHQGQRYSNHINENDGINENSWQFLNPLEALMDSTSKSHSTLIAIKILSNSPKGNSHSVTTFVSSSGLDKFSFVFNASKFLRTISRISRSACTAIFVELTAIPNSFIC